MSISPITAPAAIEVPTLDRASAASGEPGFSDILHAAMEQMHASETSADQAVSALLTGGQQELHTAIIATQVASLNFSEFLQVRNKVVSAYEEIMRTQL